MKNIFLAICLIFSLHLNAQDTVKINTSAQCESCKKRLESKLSKIKGISNVDLDVDSKVLTVIYDKKMITSNNIEDKVTEIGYDANNKPAKKAAYKRLPACCRKDYKGSH